MKPSLRLLVLAFTLAVVDALAGPTNFLDDVLPVFKEHCLSCHNPDKKKAGLDLTTLQAIQIGSSGGEIVKAGVPDTSVLYMSINHDEDFEPMPPKKPKLSDTELRVVHSWIAGGLVESSGGNSQLREMSFDVTSGSSKRPEHPSYPINLPKLATAKTNAPPPIIAMDASPWADLVAVSGHGQILLYGKGESPIEDPNFVPVANGDLIVRKTFDENGETTRIEGKSGNGARFEGPGFPIREIAPDALKQQSGLTFAAWIRPDLDMQSPTIFGRDSFEIFLEKAKTGWKVRSRSRDEKNGILYLGRIGNILENEWQHIAVTCDGKEWTFYYNGEEVVRQSIPEDKTGFLDNDQPFYIGSNGNHEDREYHGGMDDFRFYRRALSTEEIATITNNTQAKYNHIGSLPFPAATIHDLKFSPNGSLLVASGGKGAYSGKVVIYDVNSGEIKAEIGEEQDVILSADISPDHQYLAIGTPSKLVKVFSVKDGKVLHRIEKHTDWVTVTRFSPDGKWLATADRNGGLHIWETESGGIVYTLDEHKVQITALAWRPDGQVLVSGGEDGKMVLWDMKDGWPSRTASAHSSEASSRYTQNTGILDLDCAQDGKVLSVGRDRKARLWLPDGTEIMTIPEFETLPLQISFGPSDSRNAFVGDLKGNLYHVDLATGAKASVKRK